MPLSLSGDSSCALAQPLGLPFTPRTSAGIVGGGLHTVGTRALDAFGNVYRYALAGVAPLVAGNWLQAPAQVPLHQNLAPIGGTTFDVGATSVTVVLGATAAAANQYAQGWAIVSSGPGAGQRLQIASHPAANASASLTLTLSQPIDVQIVVATSKIDLVANPYSGVIQTPTTTLTGACVGVATSATPAGAYDWIQTHGVGAALIAGTPGVGLAIVVPGTAAGVAVIDGAAAATQVVGAMLVTGVDGRCQSVMIRLE
jgi:hypothetical protein